MSRVSRLHLAAVALLVTATVSLAGCGSDGQPGTCSESTSSGIDKKAVVALNDQLGTAKASYTFDANTASGGERRFPFQVTNIASAVTAAPLTVKSVTLSETDGAGKPVSAPTFTCVGPSGKPCAAADFAAVIPSGYNDDACKPSGAKTGVGFEIVYTHTASAGARKATLTLELEGDPETPSVTVNFETTLGVPRLTCAASVVNFGTVKAKGEPQTNTVKCTNVGTAPVTLKKVELFSTTQPPVTVGIESVPGTAAATVSLTEPYTGTPVVTVTPGKSVGFVITLGKLEVEEQIGATLQITSNSTSNAGVDKIFVNANSSGPCLKPSPGALAFGEVGVGQPKPIEVLLDGCGTEEVTVQSIALGEGTSADIKLDFSTGSFEGSVGPTSEKPLVVQPNAQESFRVVCTPSSLGSEIKGTVVIQSKDLDDRVLDITCKAAELKCPVACVDSVQPSNEVVPQTPVKICSKCSTAGAGHVIANYTWSLKQPDASQAALTPNNKVQCVNFTPNVAGEYTLELQVNDDVGTPSCKPAVSVLTVVPNNKLHIELTWDTPNDKDKTDGKGADLDLHLAHPDATSVSGQPDLDGNKEPDWWWAPCFDCFWLNPAPEWGDPFDLADNPKVELDDQDGWGPENIAIPIPETGVDYTISVYAWDDANLGASTPRIRIYVDKQLVIDQVGPALNERDMWCVGQISYDPKATTTAAKQKLFKPCKGADNKGNLVTPKYPPVSPTKNLKCS